MVPPSRDHSGSVSIASSEVTRVRVWLASASVYTSRLPPRESVSASVRPSGDHAGAPLIPARAETRLRLPLARSWTYIADALPSNDTEARRCPSGDQDGDISGSGESATLCGLNPSASDTISL